MIGNVWEWTTDWYSRKHAADEPKARCIPANPRGASMQASYDPRQPTDPHPAQGHQGRLAPVRRQLLSAVIARPRRYPEPVDTSSCHLGFRCVVRDER